jgi:murein DD-endopeptidase MepM/ murein hydrolase activator NlpD
MVTVDDTERVRQQVRFILFPGDWQMGQQYFYPLEVMRLRDDAGVQYNTLHASYGMVRDNGARPHQGWDLYAPVGTPVFAVGDGVIQSVETRDSGDYGKTILLIIKWEAPVASGDGAVSQGSLGAFYAHLDAVYVEQWKWIKGGEMIGRTGITGNAKRTPQYPHLHFELRTSPAIPGGKDPFRGRVDPVELFGAQLLSCGSNQLGGVDLRQMISTQPDNTARPITRQY